MNEMILLWCTLFFSLIFLIYLSWKKSRLLKYIEELQDIIKIPILQETKPQVIDVSKYEERRKFLDDFILLNFKISLYTEILPLYNTNKSLQKKQINEIRNKIFAGVIGKLRPEILNLYFDYFTEKGFEMYVHEKIWFLLNEVDYKYKEKGEFFKDVNLRTLNKIIS